MFGAFRFFLAMNVVLYHILSIPSIGPFAVFSFFMLSGFLMTTIMHKTYGYSVNGLKRYAGNRFLRLYPVYWVLIAITAVILLLIGEKFVSSFHSKMSLPSNLRETFANISMIYPMFNPVEFPVRLSPATWALTIELFYYLLIGLGISKNKLITNIWFSTSLFYTFLKLYQSNFTGAPLYGDVISASLPFSMGAFIFFYKEKLYKIFSAIPAFSLRICLILFVMNLIAVGLSGIFLEEHFWKFNLLGTYLNLAFSLVLITYLFFEGKNIFSQNTDSIYGDLSYPLYIFHWTGAILASWMIFDNPISGLSTDGVIVFSTGTLITLFISLIVNRFINNPIEKIRKKVKRN